MSNRNHQLEQILQAAEGLGASACATALNRVHEIAGQASTQLALDEIANLSALSERAQTCMSVAGKAEAEGDHKLAELGWLHALSLMNYMAREATNDDATAGDEEIFSCKVAASVH